MKVAKYFQAINSWGDVWTAWHIACGAFIAKVCLWLGCSPIDAVLWVFGIGIAWEVFEYYVEGWKPYVSKKIWLKNTVSDVVVETGIAIWIVL